MCVCVRVSLSRIWWSICQKRDQFGNCCPTSMAMAWQTVPADLPDRSQHCAKPQVRFANLQNWPKLKPISCRECVHVCVRLVVVFICVSRSRRTNALFSVMSMLWSS